MKIYCSHANSLLTKGSNYRVCHFCGYGWYTSNPAPLVVIGYTDPYEASPNYADQFAAKDLSKKQFKRCEICKDLLEKRKHYLCAFSVNLKLLKKRHAEAVANVMRVLRGFKKDK